ncbi:MAG: SpoIID/LytB domain-containing protein [Bacteroidetes bacterium]|nr:SpoIID/LytB domain-containing protein [Bacteroidota bacterium]
MKYKINILISLICCYVVNTVTAQDIDICLYSDYSVKSLVVAPFSGKYELYADGMFLSNIPLTEMVRISLTGDSLNVKNLEKSWGVYRVLEFKGVPDTANNNLKIKPAEPDLEERIYNEGLVLRVLYGRILIINRVGLEYYIAGVVETEGGPKAGSEYYKSQAIICRTYMLENRNRHEFEGYNLCDGVHCQAYKSCCMHNFDILESTLDTKGLVIVDTSLNLITAAFHSNSGGQTANSEDVWILSKPYLCSIRDDYWQEGRNAYWTRTVEPDQWISYLKGYGIRVDEAASDASTFAFEQNTRLKYYTYNGAKIPLKDIRYDWKFKSAFFSIVPDGNQLIIKGRGYGHGVGLSQEGAMKMSDLGFSYKEIINYYYVNTFIVPMDTLMLFDEDKSSEP